MTKVVIIGGMAAGCKTATRLKRLKPDFDVAVIEKNSFVSFGTCGMPFYVSGEIEDFFDLASTPWGMIRDKEYFKKVKDVNVLTETEVFKIDNDKKIVYCKNLQNKTEFELYYDFLVFASGARPMTAPFVCPKSDKITNFHNPLNAKLFKEKAQRGKIARVIIIGGGFIGVELAEAMVSLWGIETNIIEISDKLVQNAYDKEISLLLEKTLLEKEINIHLKTGVTTVELDENQNPVVHLTNGQTLGCDHVFVCTGIKPNINLANSIGIKQGKLCGIKTNSQMRTNLENIYAAGDCAVVKDLITGLDAIYPFGSLANRQGKVVADAIAGLKTKFKGAIGISSIKIFGFTFASAGITEHQAITLDMNYDCVWGTWYDKPDYMPDSKVLFGKLIYEKKTLRLLGLQLAGRGEITRYIDVFSVFVSKKGTADDLCDFEHAYTPSHSSPMNPLNYLGAMAIEQENESVICVNPMYLNNYNGQILDVREIEEIVLAKCKGNVVEVSIADYKSKMDILDKSKELLIVCQKGPRAYEATKFCIFKGFKDVKYLGGGIQLANLMMGKGE